MAHKDSTYSRNNYFDYYNVPWGIGDVLSSYAFIFLLAVIFFSTIMTSSVQSSIIAFSIVQIILSLATLGIVYLFISKKYHINFFESQGINLAYVPKYFTQGVSTSFLIILGTALITYLFTSFTEIQDVNPYSDVSIERLRIISIFAIFLAPIVEEVFFRGFMQPALVKHIGITGGILGTAVIFGVSHTQYLNSSIALASVIFIGLALGIVRHKSGSIMPGIFAHLINNLIAAMALFSL